MPADPVLARRWRTFTLCGALNVTPDQLAHMPAEDLDWYVQFAKMRG